MKETTWQLIITETILHPANNIKKPIWHHTHTTSNLLYDIQFTILKTISHSAHNTRNHITSSSYYQNPFDSQHAIIKKTISHPADNTRNQVTSNLWYQKPYDIQLKTPDTIWFPGHYTRNHVTSSSQHQTLYDIKIQLTKKQYDIHFAILHLSHNAKHHMTSSL